MQQFQDKPNFSTYKIIRSEDQMLFSCCWLRLIFSKSKPIFVHRTRRDFASKSKLSFSELCVCQTSWTGNPQKQTKGRFFSRLQHLSVIELRSYRTHHVPNFYLKRLHYERTAQVWGMSRVIFTLNNEKSVFVPSAAAVLLLCKMKLVLSLS